MHSHSPTVVRPSYGLFICQTCRDEPSDDCGDSCAMEWPDELAPVGFEYWPACKCCGRDAHLIAPLVPAA
jgi:hypothetical protein